MQKPIIGITANMIITEGGALPGTEKAAVNHDYILSIARAGGVPVVLPVLTDLELIQSQAAFLDGLLLSGGYDVQPLLFGEEPEEKLGVVYPDRDIHEIELVKAVSTVGKPVLGICRGIQVLNVAFGGTLHQDLPGSLTCIKHAQQAPKQVGTHTVDIAPGSTLYSIFGEKTVVNSYHHQAVKDVAPGFIVTARSRDGVIEGMEECQESFVVGVQWHPEMMADIEPFMQKLFNRFVAACHGSRVGEGNRFYKNS